MKFHSLILPLLLFTGIGFSQNILYEKGQSGFGFFGSYSGNVYSNTFGLGANYVYEGRMDFGYSYGYTIPKPNTDALYAMANHFSFSYLFRKDGDLGGYAIEPGAGFSFGRDQETRYEVFSGGISLSKPIAISEIAGVIPEFSLGGRLVIDTEYRGIMTFGGSIMFHIRASERHKNVTYIKGGLILTNYGSFYYIKLGIALNTIK